MRRFLVFMFLAGIFGALFISVSSEALANGNQKLSEREAARKARVEEWDKQNLRARKTFVTDHSKAFLKVPERFEPGPTEFEVASTPPTVRFQILPRQQPEFFGEGEIFYQAGWANWACVTRSDDNRFFFSTSDHRGRGARINVYQYRPGADGVEKALDVGELLGWHENMYTDGKIHGSMGIMSDGTLWAGTHLGPTPQAAWYAAGYRGSWLFSYNIHNGEAANLGVPMTGHNMNVHALDAERGIFFSAGHLRDTVMSWDVNENRMRFGGHLPHGWIWYAGSMFVDRETGVFWGGDRSEQPYRFLAYNPQLNEFRRYDVEIPATSHGGFRGYTKEPDRDGWYYLAGGGELYRIRPDWENGPEVETLGKTWAGGRDVKQIAICPAKRYLYYQPRGHHDLRPEVAASPLVQYDIETGQRKAIGFWQEYYYEKYGYTPGWQVYGLEIADDGSFVVFVTNGTFGSFGAAWGHPALMIVEIPEEERLIDE